MQNNNRETKQKIKVCHLTSVHPGRDTRIFYRQCQKLAKAGYDVTLIAPNESGEETVDGVEIIPFRKSGNIIARVLLSPLRMFRMARKQKAAVYHFHDPELIVTGLLLKICGYHVVFDIHENISKQIKSKNLPLASLISLLYKPFDYISAKCFHLVLAEHSYEGIYKKRTSRYRVLLNLPDIGFFEPFNKADRKECRDMFYIGRVSNLRGADVALRALHILLNEGIRFKMHFIGAVAPRAQDDINSLEVYQKVKDHVVFYGRMNLEEGYEISKQCLAGLAVLKPIGNFLYSYSTKIFEYMAISMPVITSDFQLYKDVVERYECGYCIDPTSPDALADVLRDLLNHPQKTIEMGQRGRNAALKTFSWDVEAQKLLDLYKQLTESGNNHG
ncbi:MAG: glycosyltransferase family 4 protein [bacterium]|nr:glycosyltransferase family 4 protein [bacterium]